MIQQSPSSRPSAAPTVPALLAEAMARHREGRSDLAEAGYRAVLDREAGHADALHLLGVLCHQRGDAQSARRFIQSALARHPDEPLYLNSLGLALGGGGDTAGAERCFRRALAARPEDDEIALNLAMILSAAGNPEKAEVLLRQVIGRRPGHPRALFQLGELYQAGGDPVAAEAFLERSLAVRPEAPETLNALALILLAAGNPAAAAALLERALALRAGFAEAWCNLGTAHQETGRLGPAMDCYRKALALDPGSVSALNNLGAAAQKTGDPEAAADCHHRALALAPENGKALTRLVHLHQQCADWHALDAVRRRLSVVTERQLAEGRPPDQDPFLTLCLDVDPGRGLAVAEAFSRELIRRTRAMALPAPRAARSRDGRIAVGYLSGAFRNHPNAQLVMGLFSRHDRRRFAVYGYAMGADDGSDIRRRIAADCDLFVDIGGLGHAAAARRIRADGVQILVDLMGYTQGSRPELCALRPAPVQVRLLGFPASTGARFHDYFVTDRWATPEGAARHFCERLVIMPHCYQANAYRDLPPLSPVSRAAAGLPPAGFVFGCFNQPYKITAAVFAQWMAILRQAPGSLLWLLGGTARLKANLRRHAADAGVAPARIVFAPKLPKAAHLNRLPAMDLMLDTGPVCGHITTTDALWAGVPVLTLPGRSFASRASTSHLMNLGLPALVAATAEDYTATAVRLAGDPAACRRLRGEIAARRGQAPLFDIDRYVRDLETAFALMWERAAAGQPPAQLRIPPAGES